MIALPGMKRSPLMLGAALSAMLLLAACGRQAPKTAPAGEAPQAENQAADQATPPAPPSKATATKVAAYSCQRDLPITAFFGTDAAGNPDLTLIINGRDQYDLHPTPAPKGTRYASPNGAEAGKGIIWWDQGDGTILLQQAPSAEVDDPAAGVTARTCGEKQEPQQAPGQRQAIG